MNPRSVVIITGIVPKSDKIKYEFKEGADDKQNFIWGSLSVQRSYKKPDEQYYPNDLINYRAFGKTADYMHQYVRRGDIITLQGELRISDNYEKDGRTVYGTPYVHVDTVAKIGGSKTDSDDEPSKESSQTPRRNPLVNRKRSVI